MSPLALGRILYEARVRAAWGKQADYRLSQEPYPRHEAEEMPETCWLALQQAKAVLKVCDVERRAPPEQSAAGHPVAVDGGRQAPQRSETERSTNNPAAINRSGEP